jgi:O-acetyl-ADP-ribose deacetylase (regulator of RNase III)
MIKEIECDIFESGADVICHQVNCQGVMGSGIAAQVRARYPWVYGQYRNLCQNPMGNLLGYVQKVYINETQAIMNCFSQNNFGYDGQCYTDYDAVKYVFSSIAILCSQASTIAIPYKYGCARGGGDWNRVRAIIDEAFKDYQGTVLICKCDKG